MTIGIVWANVVAILLVLPIIAIGSDELTGSTYIIRGQQVMFDQDLAAIYGYEVKRLNEQVKRNISRFPEDFMFQIEPEEVPDRLKSQFATLNGSNNKRGMHLNVPRT